MYFPKVESESVKWLAKLFFCVEYNGDGRKLQSFRQTRL